MLTKLTVLMSAYVLQVKVILLFTYVLKLMMETKRILENPDWVPTAALKWSSVVDKIVTQATMEAKQCKALDNKLKELSAYANNGLLVTYHYSVYICRRQPHFGILTILPLLLPDPRIKPDSEKVIYFTKVIITSL